MMMDQYKNETAQVHAPAALIEKTKAAVRAEENRIQTEQIRQTSSPAPQVSYADHKAYHRKSFVRKWTYPLTVAAAVVILLSVSMAMKGVRPGGPIKDGATSNDSVMMTAETAADDDEAFEAMPEEMSGAAAADVAAEAAAQETENTGGAMAEAPAADLIGEDTRRGMAQKKEMQESAKAEKEVLNEEDSLADTAEDDVMEDTIREFRSTLKDSLKIEAVEDRPDFYDSPDAEDKVYEGQTFRVVKEENGWTAYVETEKGEAYVIRGEYKDLETFLKEGYAKLEKMAGSQ